MDTVLDNVRHARLLADLANICETANIPKSMIHQSAKEHCGPVEIDWLVNFNQYKEKGIGLLMTGLVPMLDTRMMAITAALLRNFIDARMLPLNSVLDDKEKGELDQPTVLVIPNLFLRSFGKSLPAWKVQILYDVLLGRLVANKPTVVYVEDMSALEKEYGQVFVQHLHGHYKLMKGAAV